MTSIEVVNLLRSNSRTICRSIQMVSYSEKEAEEVKQLTPVSPWRRGEGEIC